MSEAKDLPGSGKVDRAEWTKGEGPKGSDRRTKEEGKTMWDVR